MKNQSHTVPSLSGTFGITHEVNFISGVREYFVFRTRLALNPKMPKELSSPSHSTALTEKHCSKIETFELNGRKQPAYNNV